MAGDGLIARDALSQTIAAVAELEHQACADRPGADDRRSSAATGQRF
ncbi:MAG TPA: hypothetical protein VF516_37230 [Kofleriaceae bacterium]